jgi:Fe-S oxidoreductase
VARQRRIPTFAERTFRDWFAESWKPRPGPPVLLWPDTFTNFLQPKIARAAVEVLAAAGFNVSIPPRVLCCGRPLYDYGMLDLAKRQLRQILETLAPQIAQQVPVVGLEPSCVAVFRDELTNLFPHDDRALRLSRQTMTLGEFLQQRGNDLPVARLAGKAIVQTHCHDASVIGFDHEKDLLSRVIDAEILDSGCCGMAGSFGFEKEKYDVSMACAERVLLPAVRAAAPGTLVVADGFSCREQIAQATNRSPLHLAEILAMALRMDTVPGPGNGGGKRGLIA